MESIVASSLDYKVYDLTHPTYQYSKVLPVSGGNSYTISAAGQEILLELPVKAMNLSKSFLYFQIAFFDTGAGANNLQYWIHADALGLIRQMQLYTRSNQFVADIYEVQNYTSII